MSISESSNGKKDWPDLIGESAYSSDDNDLGDVEAISRDFVVLKKGIINVHYYYVPIYKVEGWDGNVLWLKVTENEVKANYERGAEPDPSRYYLRDPLGGSESTLYPGFGTGRYPALMRISSKYTVPETASDSPTKATPPERIPQMLKCDLCDTTFKEENDLSRHVKDIHI